VIARAYESSHGLSMQEWRVIAVLGEAEQLTQQGIVAKTKMDKVTVSRAARSLEERGFVRREANEDDARSLWLSLTPGGRKIYVKVAPAAVELERKVLEGFSAKEIAALEGLLVRLEEAADRALE
jgi:DNA-binding MarR family transcriptional regulator